MRRLNIVLLAPALLSLIASTLAFGQNGNPPASVRKGEESSGKGMIAVKQAAPRSHDPFQIAYLRLYCTPDGNSHFQSVTAELRKTNFAPPAAPLYIGDNFAASSAFFGDFDARWGARDLETRVYHPAPATQFIIVLGGFFSIGDGW